MAKRLRKLKANAYPGMIVVVKNEEATVFINQDALVKYMYQACELLLDDPDNTVKSEDDLIEWFLDGSDGMIYVHAKILQ